MRPKIRKEQISENLLTIINSQTGNWVGGDKDKIEYIFQQIEKNNIRDLKDSNYFEIITKSELLKRQYKKKKDKPQLFVIHVGHSCNINCVYCYAKKDNNNISPKIIAGIASFLSEIPDPIWIQFMGGEPLLYIDIIEDIIYQIKRTRKSYETNFELQTNGLLLNNKNILSFLQKHQIAFGISYDGPNELSGSRYGNKTDKYDKVLNKNISILKSLNIDFGVLTVVSVSNVYKLKDVLSWAINNKLKRISFIPLISNNNITTDIYVDEKIFKQELISLYKEWIEKKLYTQIDIFNFSSLIDNITDSARNFMCRKHPCGAGNDQLAFDINGDIYPCDYLVGTPNTIIGNVETDTLGSLLKVKEKYYKSFASEFSDCINCSLLSICGSCLFQMDLMAGLKTCARKYCQTDKSIIKEIFNSLLTNEEFENYIQDK